MHSFDSLLKDIRNLGIDENDKVMLHSSLKKVGQIQGGGDTLLDAFCEYLGDSGLLVLPCHTWGTIDEGGTYNIDTPSNLGVLPNLFRKRKGVYRSMHPTHSMCAYGKGAFEFVQGEIGNDSFCGNGCMQKLLDMGAKILLMGVTLTSCTFFHLIEEKTTLSHYWFNDKPTNYKVKLENGQVIDKPIYMTKIDTSEYFDKALDLVKGHPTTKLGKIGNADCILLDCKSIYPVIEKLIKENPNVFMCK